MTLPVDVLGELSLSVEGGEQLLVEGHSDTIAVDLPSLSAGRSLVKHANGRSQRQRVIGSLQAGLRHADLTLQVRVAGRPVAHLAPQSKATVLSRLLGLGPMKIKPLALFLAIFRPKG